MCPVSSSKRLLAASEKPWQGDSVLWPRAQLTASAQTSAKRLLGAIVESHTPQGIVRGRVVETEAYDESDPASHSYRGVTPRTVPMFGPAGHAYIYRSYGIHLCFNITCGQDGHGAAVLIRALQPLDGLEVMAQLRGLKNRSSLEPHRNLCRGPGNLTQALGLHIGQTGTDLVRPNGSLRLVLGTRVSKAHRVATARIGISQGKDMPWRFFIRDNPFVSASRRA